MREELNTIMADAKDDISKRALRVALCQRNFFVGDLDGNVAKIRQGLAYARESGADLVLFPELAITGYPPEDLLLKPQFAQDAEGALLDLASEIRDLVAVVGYPRLEEDLYNCAAVLAGGEVQALYRKRYLPNYGVFDEQRYFGHGDEAIVIDMDGARIGITICEDLWYPGGPAEQATVDGGAEILVNISASPYHRGKGPEREGMLATRCIDYICYLVFCNSIGGQDVIVFDGHSLVIDPNGSVIARGAQFAEDNLIVDLDLPHVSRRRLHDPRWRQRQAAVRDRVRVVPVPRAQRSKPELTPAEPVELLGPEAEVYQALILGTADYFRKNGFAHAVLGLSGGVDSALSLAVAADALGSDAVTTVFMPSRFTSEASIEDVRAIASLNGVHLLEIPIDDVFESYLDAVAQPFAETEPGVAEENFQARIRGNILMALSNKFGWLVLTTGNKSEMSVGYATLYGDMAGGFSILKDVPKTWVYRLVEWRNRRSEVVPRRVIDKPPSAELRPNQLDTDSLPPYEILDPIMEAYVEDDRSPEEIAHLGFDPDTIRRIVDLIDGAEYKRRQAPPGIRISPRAFGKDRRLPITSGYPSSSNSD